MAEGYGLENKIRDVESRVDAHEQICAHRYEQIVEEGRRTRAEIHEINRLIRALGLMLIAGLASVLASQVLFK